VTANTFWPKPGDGIQKGERPVIRARRHWAVLLKALLPTVGIVIGAFLLSRLVDGAADGLRLLQFLLWSIAAVAVARFAWRVLEWWREVITVTDRRFVIDSGVIATKNSMIPLNRVTDMSFQHTVVGRLLGYGTLRLESAGQRHGMEKIDYLPEEVFHRLFSLL
jgi:uncharacterized membrane protein YdbT with pleckstrin-like domain